MSDDDMTAMEQWAAETGYDVSDGNNSNSDLDLIEGDGIGGDNSLESNEEAAEQFSEDVASGEDAVAPDSEVNAVLGTDGEAVAVAANEDEIEQSDATFYTQAQQSEESTDSQDSQQPTQQPTQQMRASYQQLLTRLQGQQQQSNDSAASPALAVGGLLALGIAGYVVMR